MNQPVINDNTPDIITDKRKKIETKEKERRRYEAGVLLNRLNKCEPGGAKTNDGVYYYKIYEETSCDILKLVLSEQISQLSVTIRYQKRTCDLSEFDYIRRDITIMNISKAERRDTFWNIIKNDYDCKLLVFECKNYSNPISRPQIHQTVDYLNSAAGKVGFVLCRDGKTDSQADTQIEQLRINKTVILIFGDDDLKELLRLYVEGTPEEIDVYFLTKYTDYINEGRFRGN